MTATWPGWSLGRVIHNQRWRSGVPLGGLGCGKLELLTDGAFGAFSGNHNWDRPTEFLRGTFFALEENGRTVLLRRRRHGEYPNVQNVADTSYVGLFPRARVQFGGLDDLTCELEAHSPLIPQNIADSALPIACFTFHLKSTTARTLRLLFSWENLLGVGGRQHVEIDDRTGNQHAPATGDGWSGLRFTTAGTKPPNVAGEYLIVSDGPTTPVTHWDPQAGMFAREITLRPDAPQRIRFLAAWFMPQHVVEFTKRHKQTTQLVAVDAGAVLDGCADTIWKTHEPTSPGEDLAFDLGTPQTLDRITMRQTWPQGDFTRTFQLACSDDGVTWTSVAHEREAPRAGVPVFTFPARAARYWRIEQHGYGPDWRWQIAEAHAYHGETEVAIAQATGHVHPEEFVTSREDLGHYYLNAHATIDALVTYAMHGFDRLDAETRAWQNLIVRAELPDWLRDMLLNHSFPAATGTILTRDGRFSVCESPVHMDGALGTMDQRMAAHAFWLMMFPELDRRELELYATCQERVEPIADGRIPHFCGNFHESVGDPMVTYGTTDWPDLTCSWVMQVLKHYRWTANREFLERCWPHVQRAMTWLAEQDTDGDGIPEGGSTYDYEWLPRGAFIFTASVYLGALRAADEIAHVLGQNHPYTERFEQVQRSVLERLYDRDRGTFIKWRCGEQTVPNTFVAALAGDWMMRLTGLPPLFPADVCESTLRETLARHAKSFHPIPPMEVTPEGECHTKLCFVLQHEPYLGCEAIYQSYVRDGLDVIQRIHEAAWERNWSPWNCSLNIEAPYGRQSWLLTYMTATAVWHTLPALAGMTLDLGAGELYFTPRTRYHGPLFFPTFWLWLDCEPGHAEARVLEVFAHGMFQRVNGQPQTLEIRRDALWDLSAYANLPAERTAPVGFPDAQPPAKLKPWRVRTIDEETHDAPPLRSQGIIDDERRNCWSTERPMRPGDWVAIDFGERQALTGVRLDQAAEPNQWPRGLRIDISDDGASWQPAATLDENTVRAAIADGWLNVPFSANARHMRLVQLGTARERWSICGVDLL